MITPEQIAKESEDSHQIALMCWCNLAETKVKYPQLRWLYHCPNGGQRNEREGAKFKAMGVKRGVPDLHLVWAKGPFVGLIIELKKESEKRINKFWNGASDEQKEWLEHYQTQGYYSDVCYGWEDARDTIIKYLEG